MKKHFFKCAVVAMALFALAGCKTKDSGATPGPTPTPKGTSSTTPTPEPEPTGPVVQVDAGFTETPMDLGGRKIVMMSYNSKWYNYSADKDKTPNETIEVINKLTQIGLDYNCTIEVVQAPSGNSVVPNALADKAAGQTPYDIYDIGMSDAQLQNLYTNNIFLDVNDPSIKDIIKPDTNPWSNESKFSIMFGKQFGVHFKVSNSGQLLRSCVIFNKDYATKYELGNFYDMVKNKTWTWATLENLCAQIVAKSDGTVKPFVYQRESSIVPNFVMANNGLYAINTLEGYQFVANTNENALEALNFLTKLVADKYLYNEGGSAESVVARGEAMFIAGDYEILKKYYRQDIETEYTFGLLPTPLGPQMTEYVCSSYTAAMYHIFNNIEKPEQVAAVLVAMANRTSKINIIDTELKHGLQDTESAEMMEIMLNNIVIDDSRAVGSARATIRGANERIMSLAETPKQALDAIATEAQGQYDAVKMIEE